jgi:hypothetical protein
LMRLGALLDHDISDVMLVVYCPHPWGA